MTAGLARRAYHLCAPVPYERSILAVGIFAISSWFAAPGMAADHAAPNGSVDWAPTSVERSYVDDQNPHSGSKDTGREQPHSRAAKSQRSRTSRKTRLPSPTAAVTINPKSAHSAIVTSAMPAPASATEKPANPQQPTPSTIVGGSSPETPEYKAAVQTFCAGIGQAATDARIAWQLRTLASAEKEIEDRIKRLEARINEHREWLRKREDFSAVAGGALVQVVTRMKPEAAAQQLMQMDEHTAASLILKLDPKVAALLLDEVPAAKAAQLSTILAGAAGNPKVKNSADRGTALPARPGADDRTRPVSGDAKPRENGAKVNPE